MTRFSLAAGLLLAVILAGCSGDDPDCAALPTSIELSLTADRLTPANPAVCRDRDVTLVVTSEVDGVLHIHGYDDQVPATTVAAGEVTELVFTAARSGQFPIELHTDDNSQGVALGIFTVHEP
ncbi:MAG TPA: hypothetical protein VEW95_11375 [Candidatus Limnocylindrales bacterium]|nr:hypothetical protein [Candidatus Limnocylindrales bacterium]